MFAYPLNRNELLVSLFVSFLPQFLRKKVVSSSLLVSPEKPLDLRVT